MNYSKILGQIIALFKSLKLQKTDDTICQSASILNEPMYGLSDFHRIQAKELWFSKKTEQYLKNIVQYLNIFEETRLICKGIPRNELEELIMSVISDEGIRCSYLYVDKIMFSELNSLFDCRVSDNPNTFAENFYNDLLKLINKKQINWFTIVPIMKIKLNSFNFEYDGLTIIKRSDKFFWNEFSNGCQTGIDYDICNLNMKHPSIRSMSLINDIVIVCKNKGSQKFAKLDTELKIKKFIVILFSFISIKNNYKFLKSEHTEKSYCVQLPFITDKNQITMLSFPQILPCYIRNYIDNDFDIEEVKNYYKFLEQKSEIIKNRVFVATNYINHAMNGTNDNDIFLNYYISLDALFGIQGNVGNSIENGINLVIENLILKSKSEFLYRLRNELVHGGIRYIEEWEEYEEYYHKFKSDILTDIEKLAFSCLNKYPIKITDSFPPDI